MKALQISLVVLLLLLPAIFLGTFSVSYITDGIAVERAIPIPNYLIMHRAVRPSAYRDAIEALENANEANGEAKIIRAEAANNLGVPLSTQVKIIENGLLHKPASARGWLLLSEAYQKWDRKKAATYLSMAMLFSPEDYWLIGISVRDAANLWSDLDAETKSYALRRAQMLWDVPILHDQLRVVLSSNAGVQIIKMAFKDRQDDIRDMNRWLAIQRYLRRERES